MTSFPRLMLVTHAPSMRPDYATALEAALRGGARFIQVRESALHLEENLATAQTLCARYGATLLLNGDEEAAHAAHADGVHWPSRLIPSHISEAEQNRKRLIRGASVHSLLEARRAQAAGADYLVFGPVWATKTHPGAPPAGISALRAICESVEIPTFAIGGVAAHHAIQCRAAGAWGIAVIRAAWDAPNIEIAVRELLIAASAPLVM